MQFAEQLRRVVERGTQNGETDIRLFIAHTPAPEKVERERERAEQRTERLHSSLSCANLLYVNPA
jgi:hypothetical protein